MRQIGPALFALLLVGIAFFGSYSGMQSWDARQRDAKIQHDATQNRYSSDPPKDAITPSNQSEATPEQGKEQKNRDFFGPEWFLVWVNVPLASFTALLFFATSKLARDTRNASAENLAASTKATETLTKIERAYLVGGGDIERDNTGAAILVNGHRIFRVDAGNYGKTPAFLARFNVAFATLSQIYSGPSTLQPLWPFDDQFPPAGPNSIKYGIEYIPVPSWAQAIYGGFWYTDWEGNDRVFCYALRIEGDRTRPNLDGLDPRYTQRT